MLKVKKTNVGHIHPELNKVQKVLVKEETKRLNADLPKSFHMEVKNFATKQGVSMTELVTLALSKYMSN